MTPSLFLALWVDPARGATLTVCASGCGYTTIRAAEAAAVDGDVIEVQPGSYPDSVNVDRAVTIRGTGPGVRVGSAGVRDAFQITSTGSVVLERLDFQDADRCVYVDGADEVSFLDVTFTACSVRSCCDGGGAILVKGGSPVILVEDSTFLESDDGGSDGAAIEVLSGALTVRRSSFLLGTGRNGAGIALEAGTGPHLVEDCVFEGNDASNEGGGLFSESPLTVVGGSFEGNLANRGGALATRASTSDLVVDGVSFVGNVASDRGGALHVRETDALEVLRSDLCANEARYGGGLYFENGGAIRGEMEATTLRENTALDGAAAYARASTFTVSNVSVLGNVASNSRGALAWFSGGSYRVGNSLVYDNTGYGLYSNGPAVTVDWSAFGANTPADASGVASLGANSRTAVSPGLTRYTANGDCADDLLYPLVSSPLVDAGDPTVLDGNGSRSDVGAFGGPLVDGANLVDDDGDGVRAADGDCDDQDPDRYPGAAEVAADGFDQDCDGVDECFVDADADTFGAAVVDSTDLSCAHPGLAARGGDCLDTGVGADRTYPGAASQQGAACATDRDRDGYGDATPAVGVTAGLDCNDLDAAVSPADPEVVADGVDQDCDGGERCYRDADGDRHGTATLVTSNDVDCADALEATVADDCDDANAARYPGATEIPGDGIDQDCSGADLTGCYQDLDGDGIGSAIVIASADGDCTDASEAAVSGDCRDDLAAIRPGVAEVVADGVDQDCDGGDACFLDGDGDGAGHLSQTRPSTDLDCADAFEATAGTDCDDADADVNPGAVEVVGDGVDQDCDGSESCFVDGDGDGVGGPAVVTSVDADCADLGEADEGLDCDDTEPAVFPGAPEAVADGIDQDCDGTDTCYVDADGDGEGSTAVGASSDLDCADLFESGTSADCDDTDPAIRPSAFEGVGDGVDQDCDGQELCFVDTDGDGYGQGVTAPSADLACDAANEATNFLDCDDTDDTVMPGAGELPGDGVDQDCDGTEICWFDADLDGYGTTVEVASDDDDCADDGESLSSLDCDDTDDALNPGATEIPGDEIDQNCDTFDGCDLDGDGFELSTCRGGPGDCDDAVPDPPETDADGIPDACDVCPAVDDPTQADADGDGVGDACEPTVTTTGDTGTAPPPPHTGGPHTGLDTDSTPVDPAERVPGRFRADCGCASGGAGGGVILPALLGLLAVRRRQSPSGAAWRAARRHTVR